MTRRTSASVLWPSISDRTLDWMALRSSIVVWLMASPRLIACAGANIKIDGAPA
jgi:hypothetical protein